jgi:hypothetical protein
MTALGDSLGCSRSPGSNSNSGLRAPRTDRPRCRRRQGSLAVFHPLWVGGAGGQLKCARPYRRRHHPPSQPLGGQRSPLVIEVARISGEERHPSRLALIGRDRWSFDGHARMVSQFVDAGKLVSVYKDDLGRPPDPRAPCRLRVSAGAASCSRRAAAAQLPPYANEKVEFDLVQFRHQP